MTTVSMYFTKALYSANGFVFLASGKSPNSEGKLIHTGNGCDHEILAFKLQGRQTFCNVSFTGGGVLYAVFSAPLCSVYCKTILANLNARMYFWGGPTLGTTVDNNTFDLDLPASSTLQSKVSNRASNRQHGGTCLDSSEN